jgi:ergothioneine biosynthesis protein EgtB
MSASAASISPRTRETPATDEDLPPHYRRVRARTEELAAPLSAEDCAAQSMPDASPVKWHLAHTSWFFETFLLADERPFDPAYRVLFNSYYQTVGAQHPRPQRGMLTRPSLDEVLAYRRHVDRRMLDRLGADGAPSGDFAARTRLGLHHEQQHQELILTDVKHLLSQNPLRPAYRRDLSAPPLREVAPLHWIEYGGGVREIGFAGDRFHFDNEAPRHEVLLRPYALASRAVTNADFLAFVEDRGYARPELWLSDGWAAVESGGFEAPAYWERCDGAWRVLTLGGSRPLSPSEPVCHVSYYEADAFARWAGARLPTEAEWEAAAGAVPSGANFAESGWLHPHPAPDGDSQAEPLQLYGDVWEWTASAYAPYPGYRPPPGPIGEYNGKFMCNQLVLRGGSCATPRGHVRRSYRNFFYPHARWQFSGIRLARDAR